jgi:threonine synthase
MKYYSTNKEAPLASLKRAVIKGLAGDKGLYMPENIDLLKDFVVGEMKDMTFQEIACTVARAMFGDDVNGDTLDQIVIDTLPFDTPVVPLHDNIYCLELFHGPTQAFKDVGARFMARLLGYFIEKEGVKNVNVLVATSGDTGSAVANGFLGVEGINVYVLYPKGKVSAIQECQFTTLGQNITALEIDGTFDDCQALVKAAFIDGELNEHSKLSSANSINVARFLPQSFYYFYAYAQLDKIGKADEVVVSVPSGNFGNLTAGLFAYWMGLPIRRFIAANNRNDVFLDYLRTGVYSPRPSVATYANAMDVGDPSNFARIMDLFSIYPDPYAAILKRITGYRYTDEDIAATMRRVYEQYGYILDPHGACAYQALADDKLKPSETGLFLETAHPAKFKNIVDKVLGIDIEIPGRLKAFMNGKKQSIPLGKDFAGFKAFLLQQT